MSLFVWYFGTNRQYPDVAHHTILLGPRYKELLTDIFDRHVLADDFSLYLHRPTATDPNLAPPGSEGFSCSRRCLAWTRASTGRRAPKRTARRSSVA